MRSLLAQAQAIHLSCWSSLPWGYRLASVFMRVAMSDSNMTGTWGRLIGAAFLKAGVQDMPDPGPRWDPAKANPMTLPLGYCQDVARKAYQIALKFLGNPADATDLMQEAMVKLLGTLDRYNGFGLRASVSFFLGQVRSQAMTAARGKHRRDNRTDDIDTDFGTDRDEAEGVTLVDQQFEHNPYWYDDPKEYRKLEQLFTPAVWQRQVVPQLLKLHPDLPLFFERMGDDPTLSIRALVPQLPNFHGTYQTWLNLLRGKVADLLRDVAEQVAA